MLFKLLGHVAAWDIRLNRIRINFVPLNLAIIAALVAGFAGGLAMVRENLANPKIRPVTIADIVSGRVAEGTFVTVTGTLDPRVGVDIGMKGRDGKLQSIDDRLIAFIEEAGMSGVLVRVPFTPAPKRVALSGMVRPTPIPARQALERDGARLDGLKLDVRYMLAAGKQPARFSEGVLLMFVCAILTGMILAVHLKRHVIFRTKDVGERASLGLRENEPIDLRVTGRFALNARTSRRFIDVHAQAVVIETGQLLFAANIDASCSFMGIKTLDRSGTWTIAVNPGGLLATRSGEMAFGGRVRPAAQFQVQTGRRAQTVTLSFGSVDQRTRFIRALGAPFVNSRPRAAA